MNQNSVSVVMCFTAFIKKIIFSGEKVHFLLLVNGEKQNLSEKGEERRPCKGGLPTCSMLALRWYQCPSKGKGTQLLGEK